MFSRKPKDYGFTCWECGFRLCACRGGAKRKWLDLSDDVRDSLGATFVEVNKCKVSMRDLKQRMVAINDRKNYLDMVYQKMDGNINLQFREAVDDINKAFKSVTNNYSMIVKSLEESFSKLVDSFKKDGYDLTINDLRDMYREWERITA